MPIEALRIVLAALVIVWAATAVKDARRLERGYVISGYIEGHAPGSPKKIEFGALHKSIVAILAVGIFVGVALTVLGRGYGPSIAAGSAAATVLVGIWSIKKHGIAAPFSGAQLLALLALVVVSYFILRR